MSHKFTLGDRVHYRDVLGVHYNAGTIVAVGQPCRNLPVRGTNYTVQWDDVDYNEYQPSVYKAADLAPSSVPR